MLISSIKKDTKEKLDQVEESERFRQNTDDITFPALMISGSVDVGSSRQSLRTSNDFVARSENYFYSVLSTK